MTTVDPRVKARELGDRTVYVGGDILHSNTRTCPHSNNHACAFCDHDRYYASKHGTFCPWGGVDTDEVD